MAEEYKVIERIILESAKNKNSNVTVMVNKSYPDILNLLEYLTNRGFSVIADIPNRCLKIYW